MTAHPKVVEAAARAFTIAEGKISFDRLSKADQKYCRELMTAALDAAAQAGELEWGVEVQTHVEPVVLSYHSKAIALAMLEDDDSGVLVSRMNLPWERSE